MRKKIMTVIKIILLGFLYNANAQSPASTGPGNANNDMWSRSGNIVSTGGNIFGTRWNSPIYSWTNSAFRAKLNSSFTATGATAQYSINGYTWPNVDTSGYMLFGIQNNDMGNGNPIYTNRGAFSLLHLNGPGSAYQQYGYRPWMKTGVTFTGNRDLAYFGLRQVGTVEDRTEAVFLWADNGAGGGPDSPDGPDNLVFRFSGYGGGDGAAVSSNRTSTTDLDGLHVATFNPTGYFGLGNTFGLNAAGMTAASYVRPQSLMHMSYDYRAGAAFQPYGFMQVTYRRPNNQATDFIGQGESANDGLRFGIDNNLLSTNGINHLNGYLRWQENSPFIFQTDWNTTTGGTTSGERMRISSVSAPGVAPASENIANTTRVSINYDGIAPIVRPRALVHVGYDNASNAIAPWMDKGYLAATVKEAVFLGITPNSNNSSPATGVLGFGATDLIVMNSVNGEMERLNQTTGNLGIGNFGPTGLATAPTQKIDVNGNARLRNVPTLQSEYLMLGKIQNASNPDDVVFSKLAFSNNPNDVLLGNGTWGSAGGGGGYFDCSNPAADMTFDSRFNLNGNNFHFEGQGNGTDRVSIGFPNCPIPTAKLDVLEVNGGITGKFESFNGSAGLNLGVWGYSGGSGGTHIGVLGRTGVTSATALFDAGVYGSGSGVANTWAGYFTGDVFIGGLLVNPSDENLKKEINPLENALSIVSKLESKTYFWDKKNNPEFQFSDEKQYGFISQEVQKILPEVVKEVKKPIKFDEKGEIIENSDESILGINYSAIIPINTAAINELNIKLEDKIAMLTNELDKEAKANADLNKRLTELENCLSGVMPYLCQLSQSAIEANSKDEQDAIKKQLEIKLSYKESIVLNQNVPNPFAEQTIINFSIPSSVKKAQLQFYTVDGRNIQSIDIEERGSGSIKVFGTDLSSGIYMYSLIVDGIIVSTKKLIKQ